ncbi:MAG: hypothetical protein KGN31_02575 [Betaproteobacteria bacterium]|nr:hypothetical protein [Betaproteobacteria bacterium]
MIDSLLPPALKEKLLVLTNSKLEKLLQSSSLVLDKLKPHQGKTIELMIGQWRHHLVIRQDGLPQFVEFNEGQPDLSIVIKTESLTDIIQSPSNALHHMHIQGNSALANDLGFVAKHFRPDLEELLSHFVGDLLAYRVAELTKHSFNYGKSLLDFMKSSITEYLTEEKPFLVGREEFTDWRHAVEQLNQQVNDIERRLKEKL